MPTYSSDELKELLAEKNELKARISQLEEELQRYKLNEEPM